MLLVKDLREKSGAPISDVKSALVEANWDPGTIYTCAWTGAVLSFAPGQKQACPAQILLTKICGRKVLQPHPKRFVRFACVLPQHRSLVVVHMQLWPQLPVTLR